MRVFQRIFRSLAMSSKIVARVFAIAAFAGFVAPVAAQSFATQPTVTEVSVRVAWSTTDQIWDRCGPNKYACATVAKPSVPYSQIWTEKPSGTRDRRKVCTLGHEFLHSLGADHKD
jgi:hypothetical protein